MWQQEEINLSEFEPEVMDQKLQTKGLNYSGIDDRHWECKLCK
jgi:hypothetical protein